jgi:uncharacterized protein (DUF1810 family)
MTASDRFGLDRFVEAQAQCWPRPLDELRAGKKRSHWMWFVFPQIAGLGRSPTAIFYAIGSPAEARAYLAHPLLGPRLLECVSVLLDHESAAAESILGPVDAVKLRSSMTLFETVAEAPAPYAAILERFYRGARDPDTLRRLAGPS